MSKKLEAVIARHASVALVVPVGALVLAGVGAGCRRTPPPPDTAEVTARARAVLGPFQSTLKAELTAALAESPEHAIDVCSKRALELAREASRDGVVVGRSGAKLRNPKNAPRPWLAPVIDGLSRAPSNSDARRVVALEDGRVGYAEAIWTAPPCLTCHGETVAPGIEARLRERYPDDQARGFRAGDFRGVLWAELPAASESR